MLGRSNARPFPFAGRALGSQSRAVQTPCPGAAHTTVRASDAQQRQPAGHGVRVLYALQGATDPPTFTLFVNRELPHTYMRYLERSIREAFEFGSTPLKLRVRKRTD